MSRYIDSDALLEYWTPDQGRKFDASYFIYTIECAPSIDLVRCAECKHRKRKRGTFKGEPIFFYRCAEHNRDVESDDYCSYGEREGE